MEEQGIAPANPVRFQNDTRDNPLLYYYFEICDHTPDERYTFLQNMANHFEVWPRKIKQKEIVEEIKSDDCAEIIGKFFKEIWKQQFPRYKEWGPKEPYTFLEFTKKLDDFYSHLEEKPLKDGAHFMRKLTDRYRKKYNLSGDTLFVPNRDKKYDGYFVKIAGDYGGLEKLVNYDPKTDKIHIDHILSCQVFSAILGKLGNLTYSFDRFYSLKSWINKCWNFIMLPATINGRKGHIEKKIIEIIKGRFDSTNFSFTFTTQDEEVILNDYFKLVASNLKTYAKKESWNQMRQLKGDFQKFLQIFDNTLDFEAFEKSYRCENGCFCLKPNQSKLERYTTFHLFCTLELPGVFANFSTNLEAKFEQIEEVKKKTTKQKRVEYYNKKAASKGKLED